MKPSTLCRVGGCQCSERGYHPSDIKHSVELLHRRSEWRSVRLALAETRKGAESKPIGAGRGKLPGGVPSGRWSKRPNAAWQPPSASKKSPAVKRVDDLSISRIGNFASAARTKTASVASAPQPVGMKGRDAIRRPVIAPRQDGAYSAIRASSSRTIGIRPVNYAAVSNCERAASPSASS